MAEENTVFIGKKSTMAYVMAVITQMNSKGMKEVTLKARGKAISRAVDVAEIVRNRFVQDAKVSSIQIGTQELEGENKEKINVSTIEVVLKK